MQETYLDANASAPLRPEARRAVLAVLDLGPGNASSPHAAGRRLRAALGDARDAVAALVRARPGEVVFTSGATEANFLGVCGSLEAAPGPLVVTRAEHPSVAKLAERIAARGGEVRWAGVDRFGRWDAAEAARLTRGASLVAATVAQGVTGALEPAAELGRSRGTAAFHADAAQALGRVPVDADALGATTIALSAHKIGGPQGVGALVVREGAAWRSPVSEGAQERGRRAGTEAVALAAGFGAAARAVMERGAEEARRAGALAASLRAMVASIEGGAVLSPEDAVLPNTVLAAFDAVPGDLLLAALDADGVRVTTGTACASGARLPPEVLLAAGLDARAAARAIRLSVSWASRDEDVARLAAVLPAAVARVRAAAGRIAEPPVSEAV